MRLDSRTILVSLVLTMGIIIFMRMNINVFTYGQVILVLVLLLLLVIVIYGWYYIIPRLMSLIGRYYYWGEYKIVDNKYIIITRRGAIGELVGMVVIRFLPAQPTTMKTEKEILSFLSTIESFASGEGELMFVFNKVEDIYGKDLVDELKNELSGISLLRRGGVEDMRRQMIKEILNTLTKNARTHGQWFIVIREYDDEESDLIKKLNSRAQSLISNMGFGRMKVVEGEELRIIIDQVLFGRLGQLSAIG